MAQICPPVFPYPPNPHHYQSQLTLASHYSEPLKLICRIIEYRLFLTCCACCQIIRHRLRVYTHLCPMRKKCFPSSLAIIRLKLSAIFSLSRTLRFSDLVWERSGVNKVLDRRQFPRVSMPSFFTFYYNDFYQPFINFQHFAHRSL